MFNVIAGNTDAHAKNYSLMLERRSVQLAPLYDLLSYAAYWDGSTSIDSAMSIGGEYRLSNTLSTKLEQAGDMFGIDKADAAEIIDATRRGVYSAFEAARATVEVHGGSALAVADELLIGLRKLPLVLT